MRCSAVCLRVGLVAGLLTCLPFTARAQGTPEDREQRAIQLRELQRRREVENAKRAISDPLPAIREASHRLPPAPKRKFTEEHKLRLYPSAGEREQFAAFLRQPRTGLVRLLQPGECEDDPRLLQVGSCRDAIPPVPGGGTFYSFTRVGHESRQLADLRLDGDVFRVGFAGSVLAVMAMLGDVPLESVRPESSEVKYLAMLAPPSSISEARTQVRRNIAGFRVSGIRHSVTAPVRLGTTYVLRSTTYKFGDHLDKKRKLDDVLIAFQVVGLRADGSVTILWKEMRRQKTPKIKTTE
jgi:hypothetical protein